MTTDRIVDFPIRRPLPTGERQRTRQSAADSRALVPPRQVRGTFSSSLPGDAVPRSRSVVAGTGSDSTESGKPQALQLDAFRAGVIAAYRGDSRESPAPSNPPPASAIDEIVSAWLATLSEAS